MEKSTITLSKIKDMYVSMQDTKLGKLGIQYLSDESIIPSCLNGRVQFLDEMAQKNAQKKCTETESIYEDTCVLTRIWNANYFHFMCEILDKILFAESVGYNGKYMLFYFPWVKDILALAGIDDKRVIYVKKEDENKIFLIKNAFEIEGFTLGSKKGLPYLNKFATMMISKYGNNPCYPKKIYIKRVGKRKLLGADERLKEFDFSIVIPEEITIEEEVKYFANAEVVFMPHGAALANVVFLREKMCLIEAFPYNWVNLVSMPIIESKDIKYHMLVEDGMGISNKSGQKDDFKINDSLLKNVLKNI